MLFRKEKSNQSLLAAIDGGGLDSVLKGENLISDREAASGLEASFFAGRV